MEILPPGNSSFNFPLKILSPGKNLFDVPVEILSLILLTPTQGNQRKNNSIHNSNNVPVNILLH